MQQQSGEKLIGLEFNPDVLDVESINSKNGTGCHSSVVKDLENLNNEIQFDADVSPKIEGEDESSKNNQSREALIKSIEQDEDHKFFEEEVIRQS